MVKPKTQAGPYAPNLPKLNATTLVREIVDGRPGRPSLGIFRLAGILDLTTKAVTIWREGKRKPRDLYLPRLQVIFARYCLPEARAMIASFIPWAERNGLDRGRGYDTLVRLLLDVAAANEGCARCLHSRAPEGKSSRPFMDRECAYRKTFDRENPMRCAPLILHPDLLATPWRGPDRSAAQDIGEA